MEKQRIYRYLIISLCGMIPALTGRAGPFLQKISHSSSSARVIHLLNYFDTCQAVLQSEAYAFRVLREVDGIGIEKRDARLRRYARFLKDSYAKHSLSTDAQQADLFLNLSRQASERGDPQIAAVCRHIVGQFYFNDQQYGKAFEHMLAANKAFRKIGYGRIPAISRYLYELAFNYYHFSEYEKVVELLTEATHYPPYNPNLDIQVYNTLGMATTWLAATKDSTLYSQAGLSYRKAIETAGQYGDSLWVGIAIGNLANVYENQHEWAKSLKYYLASYQIGEKFGGKDFSPRGEALSIASLYLRLGQPDSCRQYLRHALNLARIAADGNRFEDEYFWKNYYDTARKYYWIIGEARQAYAYFDSLSVVEKQIDKRRRAEQLSMVQKKLLIQKHQSEVEALEAGQQAQRRQFWLVAVGLALLAGMFIRLYYLSRARRRQERVIGAEKEKSLRLEKQIVEEELRNARADLSDFVENLNEKNALIDAISAQLEQFATTNSETAAPTSLTEARQKLLNSTLLTPDDWEEFRRRFERVPPGFFWQLRTQIPDVSPAEERLLALSQLRLDTRQMSRMLGISPQSIRMTRYRLRKKIGAEGHGYLAELLGESPSGSVTN